MIASTWSNAPTQVLTEYLRWTPTQRIDGIEMQSSQSDNSTYVLFIDADEVVDLSKSPDDTDSPRTQLAADLYDEEPLGSAFTLDTERVVAYEVNRKVEPIAVAERISAQWTITKPARIR